MPSLIQAHINRWKDCTRCEIGKTATNHVFYRGTVPCDVLFVGEGPGETEDKTGEPFRGKSGKLLDEWIAEQQANYSTRKFMGEMMKVPRFLWAITNTVCCRPTLNGKNRPPTPTEISNCAERFTQFVRLAKPKCVVFLGKVAASKRFAVGAIPTLGVYHPAYVLYGGGSGSKRDLYVRNLLASFLGKVL